MDSSQMVGYVIFPNHTNALRLYQRLKGEKIPCTLAPTPRECSVCCGVSVRLSQVEDIPRVKELIQEENVQVEEIATLPR